MGMYYDIHDMKGFMRVTNQAVRRVTNTTERGSLNDGNQD